MDKQNIIFSQYSGMENTIKWIGAIVLILILILLYYIWSGETFISFTANLSEYGPQPIMIISKFQSNKVTPAYTELDAMTRYLTVLEVYNNQTYKTYSDDGLVREGPVPGYLWDIIRRALDLAPDYAGRHYCKTNNNRLTQYNFWINGYNIDMGAMMPCCIPGELMMMKKIMILTTISDISR